MKKTKIFFCMFMLATCHIFAKGFLFSTDKLITQFAQPQPTARPPEAAKSNQATAQPGWRPVPNPTSFPENPFQGSQISMTPMVYQKEFEALGKQIRGVMAFKQGPALMIGSKLVKVGEGVHLIRVKKTANKDNKTDTQSEVPLAIFSGIDESTQTAIFILSNNEFRIPLPTPRTKLEEISGSLLKWHQLSTATFIGTHGYFLTDADAVPEPGSTQELFIHTQLGSFPVLIVKKDLNHKLALGRTKTDISVPNLEWNDHTEVSLDQGLVLAFNPDEANSRPKTWKLDPHAKNPRWFTGAPFLHGEKFMGIVGQQDGKLQLLSERQIQELFPEALTEKQVPIKSEEKPSQTANSKSQELEDKWKEEDEFFNPEKVIGIINALDS
jgi:hypothetical protein